MYVGTEEAHEAGIVDLPDSASEQAAKVRALPIYDRAQGSTIFNAL